MIDQIGGWSSGKVGEGYGEGDFVTQMEHWMKRITVELTAKGH